jgi:pyruvyltransferase
VLSFGGICPEVYGDPAMLMPLIVDAEPKIYDLGIVPHYTHYEQVKERYPKHRVIKLRTNDCVDTIKQITQCRYIVSSSLHGIILAHAYGIPVAWAEFNTGLKGDGVKFLDHYASVGITDPIKSTVKNPVFTTGSLDLVPLQQAFDTLRDQIQ